MAFFKTIMLPHPALHGVAAKGLKQLNSHTPVPKALIQSSLTPVPNQLRNTKALSVPFLQVRGWAAAARNCCLPLATRMDADFASIRGVACAVACCRCAVCSMLCGPFYIDPSRGVA